MIEDTDNVVEAQDETSSQAETLENLDIASLRKYSKLMGIAAARDWGRADFIRAIQEKQKANAFAQVVLNDKDRPAPGYARIIINRDPTPGHANSPVQVAVNGHLLHIPRGVAVDVPRPFLDALSVARTRTSQQTEGPSNANPGGTFRDEDTLSYSFQLLDANPGGPKWRSPMDSRSANYAQRKAFADMMGRWPTAGELAEAVKAKIIKEIK